MQPSPVFRKNIVITNVCSFKQFDPLRSDLIKNDFITSVINYNESCSEWSSYTAVDNMIKALPSQNQNSRVVPNFIVCTTLES